MKFINSYNMFLCDLKRLSYDKTSKESLIDDSTDEHRMINFDKVKSKLCKYLRGDANNSCDGYWENEGIRYLIEFKNQCEANVDRVSLKNKAYDSISLLLVNENLTRETLASETILIVVYNDGKYKRNGQTYSSSEAMDKMTQKLKGFAGKGEKIVKFGLADLEGKLFKEIHTIQIEEFRNTFYPLLFESHCK